MMTVISKKYEEAHKTEFKDFERNVSKQKKKIGALNVWAETGDAISAFLPEMFESYIREHEK